MEDYERIKGVGRGAFGTVYLCRNRTDNRQVIIKEIPVDQLSTFDRQSTINEVKVLAMLHHPNIIEYYDNFIQDKGKLISIRHITVEKGIDYYMAIRKHLFFPIYLPITVGFSFFQNYLCFITITFKGQLSFEKTGVNSTPSKNKRESIICNEN